MVKMLLKICLIAVALFAFIPSAKAQQYELTCPFQYTPLPGGVTFNASTGKYRQWLCVDNDGNVNINSAAIPVQYTKLRCYSGLGDGLNAVAAGSYLQTNCYNNSGVTWTITRIGCFTDNAGASTLAATNGAGTALLTGAVTCTAGAGGAAGTLGSTVTIANGDVIKFTWISDGISKQSEWFVSLTQ